MSAMDWDSAPLSVDSVIPACPLPEHFTKAFLISALRRRYRKGCIRPRDWYRNVRTITTL